MVRQSIIFLALLSKFAYDLRENNTFVIQENSGLKFSQKPDEISRKSNRMKNGPLEIISIHSDTHSVELRNYYFQD